MKKALGCKAREIGLWELKMGNQMNKMNIVHYCSKPKILV